MCAPILETLGMRKHISKPLCHVRTYPGDFETRVELELYIPAVLHAHYHTRDWCRQ